ncbi:heat shock protein Hsp20 domain-containing protein [Cavenderia fasciculata]|uniref:Heat shock protein Hsp20 domain-containing protein n=1 Tax=Cavenderia fasciculata TaxID=261658 RepID=F4PGY2_CACFS|nr:heat shock protein Hsp20 domain-containing protein [Cavenderia fasciculata]EGG24966.1 heat shock protein Hsp20 domain-containing protein [Cavenderia fasciculata]|eukprot:XP_004362817.1 heat shock protein Hsp20 domain-containing protein [Cavenderia fasciculata]
MSLQMWNNPWSELDKSMENMTQTMEPFNKNSYGGLWKPSCDVTETPDNLMISCELPGCNKDGINLDISDGRLTISGERSYEKKVDNEKYHRIERSYGKFQRSFSIPEGCTEKDVEATFENGILQVNLKKCAKTETPKRIFIK